MFLECGRILVKLIQEHSVVLVMWEQHLKLQSPGLTFQGACSMCHEQWHDFYSAPRHDLDRCDDCQLCHLQDSDLSSHPISTTTLPHQPHSRHQTGASAGQGRAKLAAQRFP